jgi:hypothetical protein
LRLQFVHLTALYIEESRKASYASARFASCPESVG